MIEQRPDKLKHILQNLINSAIKFTDAGTVTVFAQGRLEYNAVEFTVSDTGIGIPANELAYIFDRFRQADSSKTRSYGGVGLGLHIVKTFTELLGGVVRVNSESGKGATFTVLIPCNGELRDSGPAQSVQADPVRRAETTRRQLRLQSHGTWGKQESVPNPNDSQGVRQWPTKPEAMFSTANKLKVFSILAKDCPAAVNSKYAWRFQPIIPIPMSAALPAG
jgi:hypothetical protein